MRVASCHKLWANGDFFLSSKRIIFIATGKSCRADFKSFEIQLASLLDQKFNQPILGANYLSGRASPSATGAFTADPASAPLGGVPAPFSLTFNSGGCGTFVSVFYRLIKEIKVRELETAVTGGQTLGEAAESGNLASVAYVDPSDPSTLYVSQPTPAPGSQEQTAFERPAAPPVEPIAFLDGEAAEVVILDGRHAGNWVGCRIVRPGSTAATYTVHVLRTSEFDNVNGYSDQEVPDVEAQHLRRPGSRDSDDRPGSCSLDGCVVS